MNKSLLELASAVVGATMTHPSSEAAISDPLYFASNLIDFIANEKSMIHQVNGRVCDIDFLSHAMMLCRRRFVAVFSRFDHASQKLYISVNHTTVSQFTLNATVSLSNHTTDVTYCRYRGTSGTFYYDEDDRTVYLRFDNATTPEFWLSMSFTLDQLEEWYRYQE